MDSLLSIVQMPAGIPVGTLAIGTAGAKNAALFAAAILANKYPEIRKNLKNFRREQTQKGMKNIISARFNTFNRNNPRRLPGAFPKPF